MDEMNVAQFIISEMETLVDFGYYWMKYNKENPKDSPNSLSQKEWVDQLRSFVATKVGANIIPIGE